MQDIEEVRARGISEAINEILAKTILKGEGMFGTVQRTPLKDLCAIGTAYEIHRQRQSRLRRRRGTVCDC